MSEVEKLAERLKHYGDPKNAGYLSPQDLIREAARRVEELEGAWAWLTEQINLSLEYDWPHECEPGEWQVYRENGGVNDREWRLVGSGETALEAVLAARSVLLSEGETK